MSFTALKAIVYNYVCITISRMWISMDKSCQEYLVWETFNQLFIHLKMKAADLIYSSKFIVSNVAIAYVFSPKTITNSKY